MPIPYYTHPEGAGRVLLIKINQGAKDSLVTEFSSMVEAQEWVEDEYDSGRLAV